MKTKDLEDYILISQKNEPNKITYKYKHKITGNLKTVKKLVGEPINYKTVDNKTINTNLLTGLNFAPWFKADLVKNMNKPVNGTYRKINFGNKGICNFGKTDFESKYCNFYRYDKKTDLYNFEEFNPKPTESQEKKLKTLKTDLLNETSKSNGKITSKMKECNTKIKNLENKMNNIMKCEKYEIFPDEKQQKIIKDIIFNANNVYDECVKHYTLDKTYFNKGWKIAKQGIINNLGLSKFYDVYSDEVRKFVSNLNSCIKNVKLKNIKNFVMKPINRFRNERTFMVPKKAVKKKGIYVRNLGKMKGLEKITNVDCDCTITYNKSKNKYWLNVPKIVNRKKIKQEREAVAGIDSGEVCFLAYHGENSFGEIGRGLRSIILNNINKAEKYDKIIRKNKNKNGNKIKNKKSLKLKRERLYKNTKNFVKELHRKTALFLCKNFKRVIYPEFRTQKMLMNKKYTKTYYNKIKEEKGEEEMRKELKKTTKNKRLNKNVKKVLNMQSHYKFKEHLINKGNEYGCVIVTDADENETTKTCANCGCTNYTLNKRIKTCENCKCKIDRDNNASFLVIHKNTQKEDLKIFKKIPK